MDLFDIAVASKLAGGGGGGGGSSDFTTAKVTIGSNGIGSTVCACADIPPEYGLPIGGVVQVTSGLTEGVYTIPLYKGGAIAEFSVLSGTLVTSGNITEMDEGIYLITGDCTITIS